MGYDTRAKVQSLVNSRDGVLRYGAQVCDQGIWNERYDLERGRLVRMYPWDYVAYFQLVLPAGRRLG